VQSYTRRQLKEDKFAKGAQEAVHWATEHRPLLVWGISIVVIVGLAVTGILLWTSRQSEHANAALGQALASFTAPVRPPGEPADPAAGQSFASIVERGKESEKELKAVASQFPHTTAGKMAEYLAGTAAIQAGDNSGAEQQLKSAADLSDKNIAALAKLALANFYCTINRAADAASIYRSLIDHPTDTVPKGEAQLQLAAMYEATDPKEAATLYQQIQKESPASPAAQIAASKLANQGK
jgi:predicted negative regulator of RcsB-dependent stress response